LYLETEEENSLEKTPDELKGLFEKRRDEGKEDEEIIREVFESNPNADIKRLVEVTGLTGLTIGRIKGQVSIRRKRDSRASEKHLEEGEVSEPDARQLVAQFGRDGLNKLKRGFLKKTLARAPASLNPWPACQRVHTLTILETLLLLSIRAKGLSDERRRS